MPVAPMIVEADPITLAPPRFGLLSAATTVAPMDDPHARNGVTIVPNATGDTVGLDPTECVDGPGDERELDDGIPWDDVPPVIVFGGFTCRTVGVDDGVLRSRAMGVLTAGEVAAVESALWGQLGDGGASSLIETADVLREDAVTLPQAVGELEEHFWSRYGGTPVIHGPRRFGALAAADHLLVTSGGSATTPLGSRWSLGGYPGTGPAGAAPGVRWLVATGQVAVRRTEPTVYLPTMRQALHRPTNEVTAVAQRTYVVTWDGIAAAIPVAV